jgi:hypothetical protein
MQVEITHTLSLSRREREPDFILSRRENRRDFVLFLEDRGLK